VGAAVAKVFDVALKQLVDAYAADWLTWLSPRLGLPPGTTFEPLDADLSTVSPQADKLFRLARPAAGLIHLELQSSWDGGLPDRLLLYNVLADHRHGGPVRSLVLLLRREALFPALTGVLRRTYSDGTAYLEFRYDVVRVWELAADDLLAGPLGAMPLAPLTDDAVPRLPAVLARLDDRLRDEPPPAKASLKTAAVILMGLRFDEALIKRLVEGDPVLEESVTYKLILARGEAKGRTEGRTEEARRLVRLLGEQRFGAPGEAAEAALDGLTDPDRLERIAGRLLQAADWDDLLATP
jgi:hypothetical protein